jgi:anti-sigma B factor antagonist
MELSRQDIGNVRLISVDEGRIDAAIAIRFKDRMREVTEDAPERIILDLSKVGFLDSSGLGALVAVMKMAAPDRRVELAGLTKMVAKVFRLTRMDTVFTIHDSAETALNGHADAR